MNDKKDYHAHWCGGILHAVKSGTSKALCGARVPNANINSGQDCDKVQCPSCVLLLREPAHERS